MSARYIKPKWYDTHLVVPLIRGLTRLGLSVWGSRVLRVQGRKSGEWRSTPVNLLTFEGKRYLVSPRGHTHWVRNIRVTHEGELMVGNRIERIQVVELPDDQKLPMLRAYIKKWFFEVGQFFGGVKADSPESELRRIAPDHPVFLVQSSP
ncbi:MAG TPA: nitroreductase/quinone reductase family protein [Candidatus Dormibacteraeota bacterium]|nr:nitroreductase/quinone reductase family protein [Candidatus Dormibacteraeota bacterium]